MNAAAFEGATASFQILANIADWVQSLSNLIGLIPNFLAAIGF